MSRATKTNKQNKKQSRFTHLFQTTVRVAENRAAARLHLLSLHSIGKRLFCAISPSELSSNCVMVMDFDHYPDSLPFPPLVAAGDTLIRRSFSQQKTGVSITIDDPVRTARHPSPPRGKVSSIVHVSNLVRKQML